MVVKASKELLTSILLIVSLVLLVLVGIIVFHIYSYANYISTEAEVISVRTEISPGKSKSSEKYADISYNIDGKEYRADYRLGPFHGVSEGDKITIRANPNNYSEIENNFSFHVLIFFAVFLLLFDILVFLAVKKAKAQ